MDKTVPDHLILALKSLAPRAPGTPFNRAEVRTVLGMHVRMGASKGELALETRTEPLQLTSTDIGSGTVEQCTLGVGTCRCQ